MMLKLFKAYYQAQIHIYDVAWLGFWKYSILIKKMAIVYINIDAYNCIV